MNIYFLFNNLHFGLEILGALAFLIVAWLAYDAFLLRRDFLTASRGIGFLALTVWQVVHAFGISSDTLTYLGYLIYVFGLLMVFLNLWLEKPVERPKFSAIFILPGVAIATFYVSALATILYALVTFFAFRQYQLEFKKTLKPFWVGFLLLSLGALLSVFYQPDDLGALWVSGHILELLGFSVLIWWVWQYLQLRIREEMVLIFISAALLIAIVVTLAFSVILVDQLEVATEASLLTNAKVMDLAVSRLKEEALAKVRYLSGLDDFRAALFKNDFTTLEKLAGKYLEKEKLGFLLITNKNGEVVLRAHALTQKEDDISKEAAVSRALSGKEAVSIEFSPAEKFSIRAAAPVTREVVVREKRKTVTKESVVGVIVAGFPLDNALVDNIKRITGLEMAVYDGETVTATTLLNPDGRTRSVGIKLTDSRAKDAVLNKGEELVLRTEINSRPALASYLPIKEEGKVVGMLSAVKPQQEILALANATNRLTLVTVAILMLILALPIYFITKRLSGEI